MSALIAMPAANAAPARLPLPLPNLTVSKGAVSLSHGRLNGSFTVGDGGVTLAGRSRAQLSIAVGKTSRSLGVFRLAALKSHHETRIKVSVAAPTGLRPGRYRLIACADSTKTIKETSEHDNCTTVGHLTIPAVFSTVATTTPTGTTPAPSTPTVPAPVTTPSAPPTATGPSTTPTQPQPTTTQQPTAPMTVDADTPTLIHDSYNGMTGSYYLATPPSYAPTTPMRLLVWMHGCDGEAEGDSYETIASNSLDSMGNPQSDDTRDFISISIGGTDDGCWNVDTDVEKVLMAIADVTTHFNIDRRHIFIAGYSSGGDLAYRTIFYNAREFAGILTVNTHPFRDTGSTEAQSLAAAAWKFNIAHVAHAQDEEYHVTACSRCVDNGDGTDPGVTPAMTDLSNAGYTVKYFVKPGTHSDPDDFKAGTGTDYDWRQYVRPFIDMAGWISPG